MAAASLRICVNTRKRWPEPAIHTPKPSVTVLIGAPTGIMHTHHGPSTSGSRDGLLPSPSDGSGEQAWQDQLQQMAVTEDSIVALFPNQGRPGWVTAWFTQTLHWTVRWHRRPLTIRCLTVHCLAEAMAMRTLITRSDHPGLDRTLALARGHTTFSLYWCWQRSGRWRIVLSGGECRYGLGGWWLLQQLMSLLARASGELLLCDDAGNRMVAPATRDSLRPWIRDHPSGSLCVISATGQHAADDHG